jgi:hypothetical protein
VDAPELGQPIVVASSNKDGQHYKPEFVLQCWRLKNLLASGKTPLKQVVRLAIDIVVPEQDRLAVKAALDSGVLEVPGRETMRRADHRLHVGPG